MVGGAWLEQRCISSVFGDSKAVLLACLSDGPCPRREGSSPPGLDPTWYREVD